MTKEDKIINKISEILKIHLNEIRDECIENKIQSDYNDLTKRISQLEKEVERLKKLIPKSKIEEAKEEVADILENYLRKDDLEDFLEKFDVDFFINSNNLIKFPHVLINRCISHSNMNKGKEYWKEIYFDLKKQYEMIHSRRKF